MLRANREALFKVHISVVCCIWHRLMAATRTENPGPQHLIPDRDRLALRVYSSRHVAF